MRSLLVVVLLALVAVAAARQHSLQAASDCPDEVKAKTCCVKAEDTCCSQEVKCDEKAMDFAKKNTPGTGCEERSDCGGCHELSFCFWCPSQSKCLHKEHYDQYKCTNGGTSLLELRECPQEPPKCTVAPEIIETTCCKQTTDSCCNKQKPCEQQSQQQQSDTSKLLLTPQYDCGSGCGASSESALVPANFVGEDNCSEESRQSTCCHTVSHSCCRPCEQQYVEPEDAAAARREDYIHPQVAEPLPSNCEGCSSDVARVDIVQPYTTSN